MLFKFDRIKFDSIDPLDNGLHEEIADEQQDSAAITLEEGPDGDRLSDFWEGIRSDIEQDPTWFNFSQEE